MTKGNQPITDPQRIRALAHPVRLQLMDLLGDEGPLTATQCAELTGQTVANCSFHLRTLAKYGYIEPAEREGREKPWQLVSRGYDIRPAPDSVESATAVEGIAGLYLDYAFDRIRAWVARFATEPTGWVNATTICNSSFWATEDELAEVSRTLQRLADEFEGRNLDPSKRPPGARPVRLFASTAVDVERESRGDRP